MDEDKVERVRKYYSWLDESMAYDPQYVAERLNVSDRTITRMIKRGELTATRVGERQLRIPGKGLLDYLVENTTFK
ncbi:MAG: helix-turn-helix domain-containing protein [Nanoarchaeota archaeon]